MRDDQISKALALWGLDNCPCDLIAQRENKVYRVRKPDGSLAALRVHRKGLRSDAEIKSELQMMQTVHRRGQVVPEPLPLNEGELLAVIDGFQIDILSWIEGQSLLDVSGPCRADVFKRLGEVAAEFHNNIDAWCVPPSFSRPSWDRAGLIGENPLWGQFWNNPYLSAGDKSIILQAKENIRQRLKAVESELDYGLIHADMVRENILVGDDSIGLIDFDDSGFGFRVFELATILQSQVCEPDYAEIRQCLVEGYSSKRVLNIDLIDMFIVLRTWTYLGWIISRMNEPGAGVRNTKYIARSVQGARQWLQGKAIS